MGKVKHGDHKTAFYHCWCDIKKRCDNKNFVHYQYYGGRGISYCERWKSYVLFKEDMFSSYSPDLTIDRINSDGNYEKSNCRWVTRKTQLRNIRRNKRFETPFGLLTLGEIAEKIDIPLQRLRNKGYYNNEITYQELISPKDSFKIIKNGEGRT